MQCVEDLFLLLQHCILCCCSNRPVASYRCWQTGTRRCSVTRLPLTCMVPTAFRHSWAAWPSNCSRGRRWCRAGLRNSSFRAGRGLSWWRWTCTYEYELRSVNMQNVEKVTEFESGGEKSGKLAKLRAKSGINFLSYVVIGGSRNGNSRNWQEKWKVSLVIVEQSLRVLHSKLWLMVVILKAEGTMTVNFISLLAVTVFAVRLNWFV